VPIACLLNQTPSCGLWSALVACVLWGMYWVGFVQPSASKQFVTLCVHASRVFPGFRGGADCRGKICLLLHSALLDADPAIRAVVHFLPWLNELLRSGQEHAVL
jgi:hypothetical protein